MQVALVVHGEQQNAVDLFFIDSVNKFGNLIASDRSIVSIGTTFNKLEN